MNIRKITPLAIYFVLLALVLASCKKPTKENVDLPETISEPIVYVLNEGNFMDGDASVSIFNTSTKQMYNNAFAAANERPLGDVLQSMTLLDNKAYWVVNNSNKIEITDLYPLTSRGVINDLELPRYMVALNDEVAYVSEYVDFGVGRVAVVNLKTKSVTTTIAVGSQPEQMLLYQGNLYVCNSSGNTISVINTTTNTVANTYTVHDGPSDIVLDAGGKAWVLCKGKTAYDEFWNLDLENSTPGALVKLELSSGTQETVLELPTLDTPRSLVINAAKDKLYYLYNNGVYAYATGNTDLSATPLITRNFYALGIDPENETIYTGTYGFSSNQKLIRYTPQGVAIDSFVVGVGTNGFVFPKK